jgi:cytochrome c oxidase subunit III
MADQPARRVEEQFDSLETQIHSGRLGMWIFLGSETLLFGALIALYVAYRILYGQDFVDALAHNDQVLGTLNTVILITSSFTAAMAVDAVRSDRPQRVRWFLLATLVLAGCFLAVKGFEYAAHFEEGIYPGLGYQNVEFDTRGARLFYTLYYFMTGLHALHVVGGMIAIALVARAHWRRPYSEEYFLPLDLTVLYWHMVDVVWIFLWPLFYLLQ